jgi:hypothetical protein
MIITSVVNNIRLGTVRSIAARPAMPKGSCSSLLTDITRMARPIRPGRTAPPREFFVPSGLLRRAAWADKRCSAVDDQDLVRYVTGLIGKQKPTALPISQPTPMPLIVALWPFASLERQRTRSASFTACTTRC